VPTGPLRVCPRSKTCPRRLSVADDPSQKLLSSSPGAALSAATLAAPVSTAVPIAAAAAAAAAAAGAEPTHGMPAAMSLAPLPPRPEAERMGALPLDAAIAAARRRVVEAEALVTQATTAEEYEAAMGQLDASVLSLERVVMCAQRVAAAVRSYNGV
jgi:hypothetical protein